MQQQQLGGEIIFIEGRSREREDGYEWWEARRKRWSNIVGASTTTANASDNAGDGGDRGGMQPGPVGDMHAGEQERGYETQPHMLQPSEDAQCKSAWDVSDDLLVLSLHIRCRSTPGCEASSGSRHSQEV